MRIRQTIKKAVAIGTGALMLGATILGASAANVSDYPSAFLKDGKIAAKIVVGEKAQAIDILGAIDIAADLQSKAVSTTAVQTTGSGVSVSNGKTHEVALGTALSSQFSTLKNAQISTLKDEKLSWNDKDIDAKESLYVGGMFVYTSSKDKEFGASPVLGNAAIGATEYLYTIDDSDMNISAIGDEATAGKLGTLKFDLLGKGVEISNVGTNEVTISTATEYYLTVGDSVTVNGKKVTLKNVGSGANTVVVDVDGVVKTVNSGAAGTTAVTVNGIKVDVSNSFYVDDVTQRSATLKIGDKITDTVKDGDSMELFGEPSRKADANWIWKITSAAATPTKLVIGADFNQVLDSATEPVKKIGEKLNLPNDYASVYMDSLTVPAAADKIDFSFGTARITVNETGQDQTFNSANALIINAPKNDMFKVDVNGVATETDTVYLIQSAANTTAIIGAFDNSDGDVQIFANDSNAPEQINLTDDQTDLFINYSNRANETGVVIWGELNIAKTATITLAADVKDKVFSDGSTGNPIGDDTGYVAGDFATTVISVDKDFDYLTDWGIVITNPKEQLDGENFQIVLPTDQVKVNAVVVGNGGSTSAPAGSVTTEQVNPVGVDFAVLDKDAPAAGVTNLIVVGGPCVNTVAARLLVNPADCTAGFAEGQATIAMFDDGSKVAMLVAGFTGQDTLTATRALITDVLPAKQSAKVITTNINNPTIQ